MYEDNKDEIACGAGEHDILNQAIAPARLLEHKRPSMVHHSYRITADHFEDEVDEIIHHLDKEVEALDTEGRRCTRQATQHARPKKSTPSRHDPSNFTKKPMK